MPHILRTLVASDIFGITPALKRLTANLDNPLLLSPYARHNLFFATEADAYAAFLNTGGVKSYSEALRTMLCAQPEISRIIGFSAGASAAWLALATAIPHPPTTALLFYGSRIRDYAHLTPCCPARLVFAQYETSFDPQHLPSSLASSNVSIEIVPGARHGFMNELSSGFDRDLLERFLPIMHSFQHHDRL